MGPYAYIVRGLPCTASVSPLTHGWKIQRHILKRGEYSTEHLLKRRNTEPGGVSCLVQGALYTNFSTITAPRYICVSVNRLNVLCHIVRFLNRVPVLYIQSQLVLVATFADGESCFYIDSARLATETRLQLLIKRLYCTGL